MSILHHFSHSSLPTSGVPRILSSSVNSPLFLRRYSIDTPSLVHRYSIVSMDNRWSSDGPVMEQPRIYDLVSSSKLRNKKNKKKKNYCIHKTFLLPLQPIKDIHKNKKRTLCIIIRLNFLFLCCC